MKLAEFETWLISRGYVKNGTDGNATFWYKIKSDGTKTRGYRWKVTSRTAVYQYHDNTKFKNQSSIMPLSRIVIEASGGYKLLPPPPKPVKKD